MKNGWTVQFVSPTGEVHEKKVHFDLDILDEVAARHGVDVAPEMAKATGYAVEMILRFLAEAHLKKQSEKSS